MAQFRPPVRIALPVVVSLRWNFGGVAGCGSECFRTNLLSIAELQGAVSGQGRVILSFRVEGVVCAVVPERRLVVLQDDSASVLLELPAPEGSLHMGDRVAVVAENCALTRNQLGIQAGTAPVVNNDGTHPALVKSGGVFLKTGRQPLRLEWFNSSEAPALNVEYEGPGILRQEIPGGVLWRKTLLTQDGISPDLHPPPMGRRNSSKQLPNSFFKLHMTKL